MAEYPMKIMVSADFLKTLEHLCHSCGMNRNQFNHLVFGKGVERVNEELTQWNDDEFQAELAMIGRLGWMSRRGNSEEW